MATVEDFEKHIVPFALDAPDGVISHEIKNAIIEFCKDTWILQDWGFINENKNDLPESIIPKKPCQKIIGIKSVLFSTKDNSGATPENSRHCFTDIKEKCKYDLQRSENPIIYIPKNYSFNDYEFKIKYAYTINRNDCEIEDFIYDDYHKAISAYALKSIYFLPNQEWTDYNLGKYYSTIYEEEVSKCKNRMIFGSSNSIHYMKSSFNSSFM